MPDSSAASVNDLERSFAACDLSGALERPIGSDAALPCASVHESTERVHRGLTREEVADFILRHEHAIRQIARRKLTQATKAVFDSEDVMASVLRRMDKLAHEGTLRPRNTGELWALLRTIISNTAVSKTRLIERARTFLTEDGAYTYELLQRLNACGSDDEAQLLVLRMAGLFSSEHSRQIFLMRLRGASHAAIATLTNSTEEKCRQQWRQMCTHLRNAR